MDSDRLIQRHARQRRRRHVHARHGDVERLRLRGTKRWITDAGEAGLYALFAVTDRNAAPGGISAFVLAADDPGLTFGAPERKMGLKGSPTREVYLDDVLLDHDRLVGAPGQGLKIALGTLDRTRSVVAAQAVGIAQGALDVATAYVKERKQFGQRLADFQGLQFMLADMEMRTRAARLLTYAAAPCSAGGDEPGPAPLVSGAPNAARTSSSRGGHAERRTRGACGRPHRDR